MTDLGSIKQLHKLAGQPFVWGQNDCCMVIADILQPRWGFDLMRDYRGEYNSASGLLKILHSLGCKTVGDAVKKMARDRALSPAVIPRDFDLGLIEYRFDNELFEAPAFYHSGWWNARSHVGVLALKQAIEKWQQP